MENESTTGECELVHPKPHGRLFIYLCSTVNVHLTQCKAIRAPQIPQADWSILG